MDLEKIIERIILNYKKYLFGIIAFILAILLVKVGFWTTIFALIVGFCGYKLGDREVREKLRDEILKRLER